jgi:hypothetical protein
MMRPIEVKITRADLIRLNAYAMPRARFSRLFCGLLAAMILGINIAQGGVPKSGAQWVALILTVVIFVIGGALLALAFAILGMWINSRKGARGLGAHTFTLRDEGLLESTSTNETLIKWGGAYALIKRRKYIYVQMSPSLFLVLPRRCFKDEDEYRAFWNSIQKLSPDCGSVS